jgi:hypothetical protein
VRRARKVWKDHWLQFNQRDMDNPSDSECENEEMQEETAQKPDVVRKSPQRQPAAVQKAKKVQFEIEPPSSDSESDEYDGPQFFGVPFSEGSRRAADSASICWSVHGKDRTECHLMTCINEMLRLSTAKEKVV